MSLLGSPSAPSFCREPLGAEEGVDDWPWLEPTVLQSSRSHTVCMTCHFFRHRLAADGIPLLTCQLHRGLISHGEHLTRRCQAWREDPVPPRPASPQASTRRSRSTRGSTIEANPGHQP